MMPQVDGWEMLQQIHEHTGVGAIPVVMFSGKVDERSAAGGGVARRAGLHRQAVRPELPDRVRRSNCSRSDATSTNLLQSWVVDHRVGVLDPLFVALSYAGSFGFVWLVIAVGDLGLLLEPPLAVDAGRRGDPRRRRASRER